MEGKPEAESACCGVFGSVSGRYDGRWADQGDGNDGVLVVGYGVEIRGYSKLFVLER